MALSPFIKKPSVDKEELKCEIRQIPITALVEKEQMRSDLKSPKTQEKINDLSRSLQTDGLLQPIIVNEKSPGIFEIIAGHLRFHAAKKINWGIIEAKVYKNLSQKYTDIFQGAENTKRPVNIIDEGVHLERLKTIHGMSIEEIAAGIGKSEREIRRFLKPLEYPEHIQQLAKTNVIKDLNELSEIKDLSALEAQEYGKRKTAGAQRAELKTSFVNKQPDMTAKPKNDIPANQTPIKKAIKIMLTDALAIDVYNGLTRRDLSLDDPEARKILQTYFKKRGEKLDRKMAKQEPKAA